jgi:DNA replication protein DnaC
MRESRPDLLVIDDMDMRALPKQSGEYLLEIVENRSTIMTSNRPLEEWGKLLNRNQNGQQELIAGLT